MVTGVESFGLFVQGIELPAEGLVHVDSLTDDYYRFDRTTHTLSGRRSGNQFRLGDLVRVAVARVDLERRELDFRLVGREAKTARQSSASTGVANRGLQRGRPGLGRGPAPSQPKKENAASDSSGLTRINCRVAGGSSQPHPWKFATRG